MKKRNLKIKLFAVILAAATTMGTAGMPLIANAADIPDEDIRVPATEMTPIVGVDSVAAHKAAVTAGQILGAEIATASSMSEESEQIFGTDYNEEPSAYLSNYLYAQAGHTLSSGAKETKILPANIGPNMAEGSMADGKVSSVSMDTRANILLGTQANQSGFTYKMALPLFPGYNPDLVSYFVPKLSSQDNHYDVDSSTDLGNTMTGLLYKMAADMGETGRYSQFGDDPADIAKTYEHFVKDIQLYVLEEIAAGNVDKKTVAIVGTNSDDASMLDLYEFVPTTGQVTSRPAEYLKYTATNVLDTAACSGLTVSEKGVATISLDDIGTYLADVDCVIAMKPTSESVIINDVATKALEAAGFDSKETLLQNSPTTAYGCYMNSVDNAIGMAVLNSQVYPDILSMEEVAAYYYSNLYHVEKDGIATLTTDSGFKGDGLFENGGITDTNVDALISSCASKISTGYAYYNDNFIEIEDDYPDIAY